MIDLNNEEEQRERNFGPIPAGSRVLVILELQTPKYAAQFDPTLAETRNGLLQLSCKFKVITGTYEGCVWYENVTLPASNQRTQLDEKQRVSARIGGSLIRAVLESSRGINPKDQGEGAARARRISSWRDLDGLKFPVRVGIDKKPFESNEGKIYWNNKIASVVQVTSSEYRELMAGGEFITDGPVTGDNGKAAKPNGVQNGNNRNAGENFWDAPQSGRRAETKPVYDDVPF